MYINDLSTVSEMLTMFMFADDTSVFINGKKLNNLIPLINNELDKINIWFSVHLLSLNVTRSPAVAEGPCDPGVPV